MKSKKQRGYMWAKHPEIAEEFERHTPKDAKMPEYADDDEPLHKKMMKRRKR